MACLLTLPLSVVAGCVATSGRTLYSTYSLTSEGLNLIHSDPAINLLSRCAAIANVLQQLSSSPTVQVDKLVQVLLSCEAWCQTYNRRSRLCKILSNASDKRRFAELHTTLSICYHDYCLTKLVLPPRIATADPPSQPVAGILDAMQQFAVQEPALPGPDIRELID